jgi:chromosome segregation ATPase
MSTPGKVLVVLVAVMSLLWVVSASQVTLMGNRARLELKDLREKIAKNEADLAEHRRNLTAIKDQLGHEQIALAETTAVLRSRLADVEEARSETLESFSRVRLQVARLEHIVDLANSRRNLRTEEETQMRKAKANAESELAKLQGETSELLDQYTKLRDAFTTTLQSNKQMVERLLKEGNRTTRRASLPR